MQFPGDPQPLLSEPPGGLRLAFLAGQPELVCRLGGQRPPAAHRCPSMMASTSTTIDGKNSLASEAIPACEAAPTTNRPTDMNAAGMTIKTAR
jgi:hypothetical protein